MYGPVWINSLDPKRYQFLERCIVAIKKRGVRAEATGGFSVFVGKGQGRELSLDEYWDLYAESQDETVFDQVASAARRLGG
jgi:hypothetical protein